MASLVSGGAAKPLFMMGTEAPGQRTFCIRTPSVLLPSVVQCESAPIYQWQNKIYPGAVMDESGTTLARNDSMSTIISGC